ncbi:MAG: DUF3618 domain-containing protein [Geminicoccaceae bacterium]|nr:DUF3618 domain-containing protein [Geminicoccaceae bacterium]
MSDDRTAEEIERDLAATRASLDAKLTNLQERLSPGQLFDEAVQYVNRTGARDQMTAFGQNMAVAVRDNPIPVALVGVGLAWLAFGGRKEDAGDGSARYARGSATAPSDYPPDPDEGASSWAYERHPFGRSGGVAYARYEGGPFGGYEEGYHPDDDLAERAYAAEAALVREAHEDETAWERRRLNAKATSLGLQGRAEETTEGLRARVDEALQAAKAGYESVKDRLRGASASVADYWGSTEDRGQAFGEGLAERREWMGDKMSDMNRRASETAHDYAARMRVLRDDYERRAHYYTDRVRRGFNQGWDAVEHRAEEASEWMGEAFERQPLLIGALGLAAGAVLASLVPMSRREREWIGPYSDQAYREARGLAEEYGDRAKRAGEAALHAAREAADEEGLTPSGVRKGAGDTVRGFADSVRHVAEEARDAAKDELKGREGATASGTNDTGRTTGATTTAGSATGSSTTGTTTVTGGTAGKVG